MSSSRYLAKRLAYQVTFNFDNGSFIQTDIVLGAANIEEARDYAQGRADELESKPAVSVKRISKWKAEDMIDDNAVDWYT